MIALLVPAPAGAQSLQDVLARVYQGNPILNAARASVRALDESVPTSLSRALPRVSATGDAGVRYRSVNAQGRKTEEVTLPRGVGAQLGYNLFDGFRNRTETRQAYSNVLAGRESLRNVEQNVLIDAIGAYLDVLRDLEIQTLQQSSLRLLEEQLKKTEEQLGIREVTQTDLSQVRSRVEAARFQLGVTGTTIRISTARFRQVVGSAPAALRPAIPAPTALPSSLEAALAIARREHPAIKGAMHALDSAEIQVKINEAGLYPSLSLDANVERRSDVDGRGVDQFTAYAGARLVVPLYDGGEVSSQMRQARQIVAQRHFEADSARAQVDASVASAWTLLQSAANQVTTLQAQIEMAESALEGVRNEAQAGQRTVLDVLNAVQELLAAQANLANARRDRAFASFAVLQAIGRLSYRTLNIKAPEYRPSLNLQQVKTQFNGPITELYLDKAHKMLRGSFPLMFQSTSAEAIP